MKIPVTRRLQLLGLALGVLAVLIVWSATMSWRGIDALRGRFRSNQAATIIIAERLQKEGLELDAHFLKYQANQRPEDWGAVEENSRRLNGWIAEQKTRLATPKEQAL